MNSGPLMRTLLHMSLLAGLLACGMALPSQAANGPILSTVGSKGPVSMPVDGDGWSMFRMPSSIAWNWDHQIDLDVFLFGGTTTMRNRLNDYESSGTTFGANGGFVFAPGRIDDDASDEEWDAYSAARKFTLGFGVFVDMAGGTGEASEIRWQTFPETLPSRAGIQFIAPTLSAAFTPTDWLAIGLGLHAINGTVSIRTLTGGDSTPLEGSPQINGVPLPGNPSYSDFLDLFSNDTTASDPTTYFNSDVEAWQYAATLSISFKPMENLGFGFSYRPRSWAPQPFEGDGFVNAERTFSEAIGGLDASIQSLFFATLPNGGNNGFISNYDVELSGLRVPRQVRLSAVFWPIPRLLIGAELAWIEWHRAFRAFKVTLKNGDNADLNFVTGSSTINSSLSQRWKNTWVYSLYAAYGINDMLTIRAGLNYSEVPVNHDVSNNSPNSAFVTLNMSLGASLNFERVSLHALFEYSPYQSRQSNARPQSATGKFTTYSARQWFLHLGATFRF